MILAGEFWYGWPHDTNVRFGGEVDRASWTFGPLSTDIGLEFSRVEGSGCSICIDDPTSSSSYDCTPVTINDLADWQFKNCH